MLFTDKLDCLMAEKGLTRGTLAEATGIPYNTIVGFYTKGYKNIKLSNLRRLADFFSVSVDMLSDDEAELETASPVPIAMSRYDALTPKSRKLVDGLIQGLLELESGLAPAAPIDLPKAEPVYIREYLTPAAAGYANPALSEDYINIPRDDSVPDSADFAVRIAGDSMEPYIRDGSRVWVTRRNQLQDGDVGIFFVDGDMKCKQYCEDPFGNIYLFSLNRARKDADVHIFASAGSTVVCFGKVLLPHRPPLPKD